MAGYRPRSVSFNPNLTINEIATACRQQQTQMLNWLNLSPSADGGKIVPLAHCRSRGRLPSPIVIKDAVKRLLNGARHRAKQKGIVFDLTVDQIYQRLVASNLTCELTGLPLHVQDRLGGRPGPYNISIDRVQAGGPYSINNIRITCFAMNVALLHWGEDIFGKIATAYVRKRRVAA